VGKICGGTLKWRRGERGEINTEDAEEEHRERGDETSVRVKNAGKCMMRGDDLDDRGRPALIATIPPLRAAKGAVLRSG
jgi:hypothetical protein